MSQTYESNICVKHMNQAYKVTQVIRLVSKEILDVSIAQILALFSRRVRVRKMASFVNDYGSRVIPIFCHRKNKYQFSHLTALNGTSRHFFG